MFAEGVPEILYFAGSVEAFCRSPRIFDETLRDAFPRLSVTQSASRGSPVSHLFRLILLATLLALSLSGPFFLSSFLPSFLCWSIFNNSQFSEVFLLLLLLRYLKKISSSRYQQLHDKECVLLVFLGEEKGRVTHKT